MRVRLGVVLGVVVAVALATGVGPAGAATPVTPSASASDITTDSAQVHATVSSGSPQGSCKISAWSTVSSIGSAPPFRRVTEQTKASPGQRVSQRIDGLTPNSRYTYTSTLRVTGFGGDFAPCRDVYELTTAPQEFTTAKEHAHGFSFGSKTDVAQGIVHLDVSARPAPRGTSTIRLEYGPTTAYGRGGGGVPCTPAKCTATLTLQPDPTVLTPKAVYHFRAVMDNEYSGTQHSPDDTFDAPDVCKIQPKDHANFTGCVFHDLDWSNRRAEFMVLNGAKMQGANLSNATLHAAKLTDTDLTGADLRETTIWNVQGSRTILNDAKMQRVHLNSEGHLEGAFLRGANLTRANIQTLELRGADLTGAHLNDAIAADVDFTGATLTGTDFSGAILDRSVLPPSIAQAICSNRTTWPDHTSGHGTECPPPSS